MYNCLTIVAIMCTHGTMVARFNKKENVMREFVVIKFVEAAGPAKEGKYAVWASYEGDIWGSPI